MSIEFDLDFCCMECNTLLNYHQKLNGDVEIQPCECCLNMKYDEGFADCEAESKEKE